MQSQGTCRYILLLFYASDMLDPPEDVMQKCRFILSSLIMSKRKNCRCQVNCQCVDLMKNFVNAHLIINLTDVIDKFPYISKNLHINMNIINPKKKKKILYIPASVIDLLNIVAVELSNTPELVCTP